MISFDDEGDEERSRSSHMRHRDPDVDGYVKSWKVASFASESQNMAEQIMQLVKIDRFQMLARQVSMHFNTFRNAAFLRVNLCNLFIASADHWPPKAW